MIQCVVCEDWFHSQVSSVIEFMKKKKKKNISWNFITVLSFTASWMRLGGA